MNPKISIVVDSKNKVLATLTGMVTVGAKVDVEIAGISSSDVPNWGADDKFTGPSLRFRVVDECGHDLVRYQFHEKTETVPDVWTWDSANSKFVGTNVDFDTDVLRKAFRGVPFNEFLEFGVILDSIVDAAQYAVGKIKIRQWAAASTEDPTILPDWRATLVKLQNDLASVEQSKTDAQTAATQATNAKNDAVTAKGLAEGFATTALGHSNTASQSASSASASASSAASSSDRASAQVEKYPKIDTDGNRHWLVWNANKQPVAGFDDTGVLAEGRDGESGAAATIAVGTVTTGAAGTNASVVNVGTSSAAVFNFTIPRGDSGASTWDDISGKPNTFPPSSHTHADYAKMITTGSLGDDSSIDDIISKINTIISQLKG